MFPMQEEKVASDSVVLSSGTKLTAESSDSNSSSCLIHITKRQKRETISSHTKFKGVVPQANGHWGAQIYCNHKRIWIGTFKTEAEAAMAYDSAAIKLRSGDCHRNFPWTNLNVQEPEFQTLFSTEVILNMIKDGSYPTKFTEFLNARSQNVDNGEKVEQLSHQNGGFHCGQLFQKELTPSDVGKLNRLVIPKKYAVKYFPRMPEPAIQNGNNTGVDDELELSFYDRLMKVWKFRYCYWTSSQSYVFTRGWNRFVRETDLKAKDVVTFYKCECKEGARKGQSFYMIDVVYDNNRENINANHQHVVLPQVDLSLGLGNTNNVVSDDEEVKDDVVPDSVTKSGFRLFGVQIG